MFIFEEGQYAPEWVQKLIESNTNGRVKMHQIAAFAVLRMFENKDLAAHPQLRDKTEMVRKMLMGFGYAENRVYEQEWAGHELAAEFGFVAVGAHYSQNFKIMWKEIN